jgi:hypothetical protein
VKVFETDSEFHPDRLKSDIEGWISIINEELWEFLRCLIVFLSP